MTAGFSSMSYFLVSLLPFLLYSSVLTVHTSDLQLEFDGAFACSQRSLLQTDSYLGWLL